ncbi:MAG: sigma 54-interacting transcriptional regulator [Magnetococcales bacterium]|nr:sigma 54-interacting transcriptional regulator [Magnetococcales bacterium]
MTHEPDADHLASLDALTDPAVFLDVDYRILATNKAYQAVFFKVGVLTGKTCFQVSHGYDRPCDEMGEKCPLQICQATRSSSHRLHVHHVAKGHEYVIVEITPVYDKSGNIIYYQEILCRTLIASAEPRAHGLVGISTAFIQMLEKVHRVARESVPVLLLGESGTGKELIARALHDAAGWANKPFIPVECSGLSETLFESELFGHLKGSFTGALANKDGLVEAVDGGTLFLDEIGDVPLPVQVKLLRLLETHTFRKVGDTQTRQAHFRLVCATNCNLDEMIHQGRFRRDLYYRISAFPIRLPPLRERREDIGLLARSILLRIAVGKPPTLTHDAELLLSMYEFPGNIRELVNFLEQARLFADGTTLEPIHFPGLVQSELHDIEKTPPPSPWGQDETIVPLKALEARYLSHILQAYQGSRTQLAAQLGISMRTLTRKVSQLKEISPPP